MPADSNDPEIRAFIVTRPADTYSGIAAAIAERFGTDRAWSADLVALVWKQLRPPRSGPRDQYADDPRIMAFIADRAGLIPLDQLLAAGAARFGRKGFPKRSQLHRLIVRVQRERKKSALDGLKAAKVPT